MTLGFSTQINGKPNYFIEKIWASLPDDMNRNTYLGYGSKHRDIFRECWDGYYATNAVFKPKLHTMREDPHDRWKAGMDIHMVINNRTKNRFQFAPVVKCVSVQRISIEYVNEIRRFYSWTNIWGKGDKKVCVYIDGNLLDTDGVTRLAINDGFDSVEDFFTYFSSSCIRKLIHWTDLRY